MGLCSTLKAQALEAQQAETFFCNILLHDDERFHDEHVSLFVVTFHPSSFRLGDSKEIGKYNLMSVLVRSSGIA